MVVKINYNDYEDRLSESYAEIACNSKCHGNTKHDHASNGMYNPLSVEKYESKHKFKYKCNECTTIRLSFNKQIYTMY